MVWREDRDPDPGDNEIQERHTKGMLDSVESPCHFFTEKSCPQALSSMGLS